MSSVILIDYSKIIKKNSAIANKLGTPPSNRKGFSPGLILIAENKQIQILENKSIGEERINYLRELNV